MGKLPAILSAVTAALLLLALGSGCATKDDVAALRADVASKDDVAALHADTAGLRASVEALAAARATPAPTASPAEYREPRSDIAALRVSVEAARRAAPRAAAPAATGAAATAGPPPAGYQKVSTLANLPEFIPGLGALYVRPQTLPAGPFLGYDRGGRLVNTVYMIPVADITAHETFADLAAGGDAVREVDFYYTPGHPGVDQPHYHVVLWHVPEETAELG
jgi:hypothetical protein